MNFVLSALKIFQHRSSPLPNEILGSLLHNTCLQVSQSYSGDWQSVVGAFKRNKYKGNNRDIPARSYEYSVFNRNILTPTISEAGAHSLILKDFFNEGDFLIASTTNIGMSESKYQVPGDEVNQYSRVVAATGDNQADNVAELLDVATMSPVQDVPLVVRVWFPLNSHMLNTGVLCLAPTSLVMYSNAADASAAAFLLWTGNAVYLVFCSHADILLNQINLFNNNNKPAGYTIGYCQHQIKQDALWIDYTKISERLYPRWINSSNSSQLETIAKLQKMLVTYSVSYAKNYKPELRNYFFMMESQRNAV